MSESLWSNVQFMLLLSNKCNSACKYCFGPNSGEIISSEELEKAILFIKDISLETNQKIIRITFHGGEPLLAGYLIWERLLLSLRQNFHDKELDLRIQTNLHSFDDNYAKLFQEYNIAIGTSLDGTKEINDQQRGSGYFKKTMKGIKLAQKYNLKIGCIATFTPYNASKYHEVYSFFEENGLSFSFHASLPAIGRESNAYNLLSEDYSNLLTNFMDLYIQQGSNTRISTLDHYIKSIINQEGQECTHHDCLGMFLAIDSDGDIFPCQRFCGQKKYSFGNIKTHRSLKEIMDSPVAQQMLIHQKLVKHKCNHCEHIPYCNGGCYYNALTANNFKDPYCIAYKSIFDKIKKRLLEEMQSEENIQEIIEKPYRHVGHPLLRKGHLINLSKH
jgi:uncharacterized protein